MEEWTEEVRITMSSLIYAPFQTRWKDIDREAWKNQKELLKKSNQEGLGVQW